jgi:hypothetical protein
MKWRPRITTLGLLPRFRAARDGAIAVEFALISTVLLTLFAVTLDLSFMFYAKRDAERASTFLTHTLTSCPANTTTNTALAWRGTDCVTATMNLLKDRMPNVLVNFPDVTFGMASIQRVSGAIRMCPGNMTYLEGDMQTSALSVLKDNDAGALAYLTITYKPFLPQLVYTYLSSSSAIFRQYTVDVRGNGDGYACAT